VTQITEKQLREWLERHESTEGIMNLVISKPDDVERLLRMALLGLQAEKALQTAMGHSNCYCKACNDLAIRHWTPQPPRAQCSHESAFLADGGLAVGCSQCGAKAPTGPSFKYEIGAYHNCAEHPVIAGPENAHGVRATVCSGCHRERT
jgi:hypothetical protein